MSSPSEQSLETPPSEAPERVAFADLDLPEEVRRGIAKAGFTHCTPIQGKVLPLSLAGRDVAGQAQTGTGKTAAFLISFFTRLLRFGTPRRPAHPRALVIAPTRELAVQIAKDAELLDAAGMGLVVQAVYGGVDYKKQRENLRQDCDILVGTPGRLIDYLKQRVYDLDATEILVIDEADRMFDMGFIKDLRFLLRRCPPVEKRQSMLFSATLSHDVQELAFMFMNDAIRLEVKPEQVTAEGVEHHLYHVGKHEKIPFLFGLLHAETGGRTIVFVNMRRTADHLCRTFAANGMAAEQITGDIDQRKRLKILEDFKEGRLPILIATDVASRGLHIEGVTHVINYDLPLDPEDYVHRVGRTARAGASGKAISIACEDYIDGLEPIEKLIGFKIPHEFPDETMLAQVKTVPRLSRRRPEPGGDRSRGGGRPGAGGGRGRDEGPRRTRESSQRPASPPPSVADASPSAGDGAGAEGAPKRKRRRRGGGSGSGTASPASGESSTSSAQGGEGGAAPGTERKRRQRRRKKPAGAGAAGAGSEQGGTAAE
ncbi:MAG: DEAD/DEAH box helicase [Alphaproteobacteria bacterium]